ncbi:MAG TPA: V-type ATPase subunit [Pseudoflavonifractor sp.]|nr:V-type ATPase subunit [Pseudoflavonifractor sp.]
MAEREYIYAVARIRSKEQLLLTGAFMEQLLSAPDEAQCLRLLAERGWGGGEMSPEEMFRAEQRKTWDLMSELVEDPSVFGVFRYEVDYHNLKAAIKDCGSPKRFSGIYRAGGTVSEELIRRAVEERDESLLPERMRAVAREAADLFLQTQDGQLCDVLVDSAALRDIGRAGRESDEELLRLYGELTVAMANIKTALRAQRTGKDRKFLRRALVPCETLDLAQLEDAAADSFEAVCRYLERTEYADAVPALKQSPAAFERWCDNRLMRAIRPQIHNCFGLGPLAAYILARENEIKTVRIILSGKRNALAGEAIRERVRETYV